MNVLAGIRVVDLGRVLAGPHRAQLMADFGAEVVKVEAPGGDENRGWPPHGPDGHSANFASVNRGKRSLVLNLRVPGGWWWRPSPATAPPGRWRTSAASA